MRFPWISSIAFATVSGAYWYIVGQFVSVLPPMMLDDSDLLIRVMLELCAALVTYILVALIFFRWLIGRSRNA